jgi:hypothetical protein
MRGLSWKINYRADLPKGPVMPGKGVKSHETSSRKERKQEGKGGFVVLVVDLPLNQLV